MSGATTPAEQRSVLDIIRGIKDRDVAPADLSHEDRQDCVAYLSTDGYSVPEIAQILGVSDRTVSRDRSAAREASRLVRDPGLAERVAGQLTAEADLCASRIRRTVRDRDTPPATRVEGERACFQIMDRLVDRLQSLGFLPTAAHRLDADVTHHVAAIPDLRTIQVQIEELEETERSYGNGELQARLRQLHGVSRLLLTAQDECTPGDSNGTVDAGG